MQFSKANKNIEVGDLVYHTGDRTGIYIVTEVITNGLGYEAKPINRYLCKYPNSARDYSIKFFLLCKQKGNEETIARLQSYSPDIRADVDPDILTTIEGLRGEVNRDETAGLTATAGY